MAPDALGRAAPLSRLSELIAHRGAQGPLAIGLLGGPGSGKTHALADIVEGAGLLATGALATPNGPFLPRISALRVDAPDLGDEPEAAIAERLHARIAREYPAVAHLAVEEAAHASSDPRQTARALAESVDAARRRVAAERQARDDAATRRARLTETVLYEAPGSQINSYARANRGRIEPSLRAFGFAGADSTRRIQRSRARARRDRRAGQSLPRVAALAVGLQGPEEADRARRAVLRLRLGAQSAGDGSLVARLDRVRRRSR